MMVRGVVLEWLCAIGGNWGGVGIREPVVLIEEVGEEETAEEEDKEEGGVDIGDDGGGMSCIRCGYGVGAM